MLGDERQDAEGLQEGARRARGRGGAGGGGARVCARVPDAPTGPTRGVRPDHDEVLVDQWHRVVWDPHVDLARLSEARRRSAGRSVQCDQAFSRREDDTRRRAVLTRPIGDPASRRGTAADRMPPDLQIENVSILQNYVMLLEQVELHSLQPCQPGYDQ